MINKLLPVESELKPIADNIRAVLKKRGTVDVLDAVITNLKANADNLKQHKIDQWLSFGVYVPAVERVIALHGGESEEDFYSRTQYPVNVVEAYSVTGDDLMT